MSLDHGLLNIPLSNRGNIDRDVDTFLRNENAQTAARIRKALSDFAAAKQDAQKLIDAMPDDRRANLAVLAGCPVRSVRKRLREMASLNPMRVLHLMKAGAQA